NRVKGRHQEVRYMVPMRVEPIAGRLAYLDGMTVVLDPSLLDHPSLLQQEMMEEFRHLKFRFLMRNLWAQSPSYAEHAAEELHTDLSKIRDFVEWFPEEQAKFILPMILHFDADRFYEMMLRALSPARLSEVVALLEGENDIPAPVKESLRGLA